MKSKKRSLKVFMNGSLVGELEKSNVGRLTFTYCQTWINSPGARPISLSLPLLEKAYSGDVVYYFFDNLLPDNSATRVRIQKQFQVASPHPFDLLATIGKDCVGAIQLIEGDATPFKKEIRAYPLDEKEIASVLRDIQRYPLGMSDQSRDFRISIAGAQEKTAFLRWKNKWYRPLGTTPTTHIFKLPIGYIQHQHMDLSDSCENEWLCSKIAAAFDLPIAACELCYFENMKALVVERFDRKLSNNQNWLMRLPQEDMCQALSVASHLKYQSDGGPGIQRIMKLLCHSKDVDKDQNIFFRSQILFWLLAAIDGHAKNFSIRIETDGQYQLTPLYDIMSAYPLVTSKQLQAKKIKMAMALEAKNKHYHWDGVQYRHFLQTAENANYSVEKAQSALDDMLSKVDSVIQNVSKQLPKGFPERISQPIFTGMLQFSKKLKKSSSH